MGKKSSIGKIGKKGQVRYIDFDFKKCYYYSGGVRSYANYWICIIDSDDPYRGRMEERSGKLPAVRVQRSEEMGSGRKNA